MGITKTQIFTEEQNSLATLAKGLGHPARIAIIQHLLKLNSCICGELVDEIGLSQATVSQHLKELKNLGLIKGRIEGPRVCYCLDIQECKKALGMLTGLLNIPENDINCC